MTPVYLAARFSRKEEMQQVAIDLAEYGIKNIASWVAGEHDYTGVPDEEIPITVQAGFADQDIEQIHESRMLILFTDEPGQGGSRGGKHVELGIALASHRQIIVVGPVENIFVAYAITRGGSTHFVDYNDFLKGLGIASCAAKEFNRIPDPLRKIVTGYY